MIDKAHALIIAIDEHPVATIFMTAEDQHPAGVISLLLRWVEANGWPFGQARQADDNLWQLDFVNAEGVEGTAFASIFQQTKH